MAYRKIHDSYWTDPDIEDLTPEQKYFYLYLITNPKCNQIGLFEFSLGRAVFETGYNRETIEKLLDYFESSGKIKRSQKTKEICICKFWHHNKSTSPKVQSHVDKLLQEVKDTSLIEYIYGMHTLPQEEKEEEEKEEEKINYALFIDTWNKIHDCRVVLNDKKKKQIRARLRSFTIEELGKAIENRLNDPWLNGEGSKYRNNWDSFWRSDEKIELYLNRKEYNTDLPF